MTREAVILVLGVSALQAAARKMELARFLRARRETTLPENLGLVKGRRRRTPGLRREELAALANIGLTWYTWLEQGRDIQVSREVIERIAAAMRLSPSDSSYLLSLAGQQTALVEQRRDEAMEEVQELLDGFTAGPAMLWNARFDCIAFNRLADAVYEWSGSEGPFGRNMVWRTFMDPRRHQFYSAAEGLLRNGVGMLRTRYASHLGEPEFESLVNVLLEGSAKFKKMWNEQHTSALTPVNCVITHPRLKQLRVRSIRALFPSVHESTLVFVSPLDDSTKSVFDRLGRS
jgi:transcriptional regulator with XRE-family HTH domain